MGDHREGVAAGRDAGPTGKDTGLASKGIAQIPVWQASAPGMATGKILAIYIYPERGGLPLQVPEVQAVEGIGLQGDQRRTPKRAVTLLSREAWQQAMVQLDDDLPASARRANLLVSGMDLAETVGRRLRIGDVRLQVHGETKPCSLMDQRRDGLRAALEPDLRGGVHGAVLEGGIIRVDDAVTILDT